MTLPWVGMVTCFLFHFPELDLAGFFIQPQVAVVPGGLDFPCRHGCRYRTPRFLPVGAVMELALADEWAEIRERILEVLFQDDLHLIRIEGRKTGGIRNEGIFS